MGSTLYQLETGQISPHLDFAPHQIKHEEDTLSSAQ